MAVYKEGSNLEEIAALFINNLLSRYKSTLFL